MDSHTSSHNGGMLTVFSGTSSRSSCRAMQVRLDIQPIAGNVAGRWKVESDHIVLGGNSPDPSVPSHERPNAPFVICASSV